MSQETFEVKWTDDACTLELQTTRCKVREKIEIELIKLQTGKRKLAPAWIAASKYDKVTSARNQVETLKRSHGEEPSRVCRKNLKGIVFQNGERWACGCVTTGSEYEGGEKVYVCSPLHSELYGRPLLSKETDDWATELEMIGRSRSAAEQGDEIGTVIEGL